MFKVAQIQDTLTTSQIELDRLLKDVFDWEQKANEIQAKFNFHLPDYIIDEIIENEDSKNFLNLHYLINCAVINDRITESNAGLLKQVYKITGAT